MKDLNAGAGAPLNAYVYTPNDFSNYHTFLPLLIDRLGKPGSGRNNRLILQRPLSESGHVPPLPPQLPPEGLPLFDWARLPIPTDNEAATEARDEGHINAASP